MRVETVQQARDLVMRACNLPAEYFSPVAYVSLDRFHLSPANGEPEGSPSFRVFKKDGKVEKSTIIDALEVLEWTRQPGTRQVRL